MQIAITIHFTVMHARYQHGFLKLKKKWMNKKKLYWKSENPIFHFSPGSVLFHICDAVYFACWIHIFFFCSSFASFNLTTYRPVVMYSRLKIFETFWQLILNEILWHKIFKNLLISSTNTHFLNMHKLILIMNMSFNSDTHYLKKKRIKYF